MLLHDYIMEKKMDQAAKQERNYLLKDSWSQLYPVDQWAPYGMGIRTAWKSFLKIRDSWAYWVRIPGTEPRNLLKTTLDEPGVEDWESLLLMSQRN